MDAVELKRVLASHTAILRERGVDVDDAVVDPSATASEIAELEALVGLALPPSFRQTLAATSRAVRWSWVRPEKADRFPAPFDEIFCGSLEWSIDTIADSHRGYLGWVETCFPDPDDPYDVVWHNKLGFASAPNGDVLAVDLATDRLGSVVYRSHDDGEGHGYLMARSLADLVDRWVPLACPGPEDWQWLPFVPYDTGPIDPACGNATAWRSLLGLTAGPGTSTRSRRDPKVRLAGAHRQQLRRLRFRPR